MKKNIAILKDHEIDHPKDYHVYLLEELDSIETGHENIYIGDLIDYLKIETISEILEKIIEKLDIDGKLIVKAPDILQLCFYCSKFNLDLLKFRYIIYQTGRISCYSSDEILMILSAFKNIKIESVSYANLYEYSITVRKNEETN